MPNSCIAVLAPAFNRVPPMRTRPIAAFHLAFAFLPLQPAFLPFAASAKSGRDLTHNFGITAI